MADHVRVDRCRLADLVVWQKAMDLAELCFRITRGFPVEERFGMVSQIRRAAASVPANIAEGWGRGTTREYIKFLRISTGSTRELETHLLLCRRAKLLQTDTASPALALISEVSRMLRSMIGSLRRRVEGGREGR